MQILLFVLTILMLLGLMTYARLDSYLGFSYTRKYIETYMAKSEREFYNLRNIKWYDDTPATKKEKEEGERNHSPASSFLNILPLISKETKEANPVLYHQVRYVFKRLIDELYSNTRFYKEISSQREDFINEILDGIESAAGKLPKGQSITSGKDLANLDLGDKQLNEAFYFILKGTKRENSEKDAKDKIKQTLDSKDYEEKPVDDGYLSILDFITVNKGRPKLRVYLASRPTLMAIAGNKEIVDEIIEKRKELFKQVKSENVNADEASRQFEGLFSSRISSIVNNTLLDYSVTKTDPSSFE